MPKIAKVILPLSINRVFDYQILTAQKVKKGMRILVNFRGKEEVGIVYSLSSTTKFKQLKPIQEAIDAAPGLKNLHFQLAKELAKHYPYPASEFLFAMLPPYLRKKNQLKIDLPDNFKKISSSCQRPIFIKSNLFSSRYSIWKKDVKKSFKGRFGYYLSASA